MIDPSQIHFDPSLVDPENPYWTGQLPQCYIREGHNVCSADYTEEIWASYKPTRCMICHPSPMPPFFDCPHGHYLTPARIEEQIRWNTIREFGWYTAIWVVATFLTHAVIPLAVITTATYLFFLIPFLINRRLDRKDQQLLALAGPWAENPAWKWEKRTRTNEPWLRRVF